VVTSRVCPALEYVRDAVLEVPPDDARAYGDAILRLVDDKDLYDAKVRGCAASTEQFYDPAKGWGATLRRVLALIGAAPETRQDAPERGMDAAAATPAAVNAR
jgi:glycosyltransferase involved in cell wall biosynthesis